MSFREIDNPVKVIKGISDERVADKRNMQIFVVTAIDFEDKVTGLISDYKCSVKSLVTKVQYDNCPIVGIGLGHFKGMLKYPEVGDMVLCAFLDGTPTPVVLGTVFDFFSQKKDTLPQIQRNEYFFTNKEMGAVLYITKDNEIIIKAPDPLTGNFKDILGLDRTKIKLTPGSGAVPGSMAFNTDGTLTETVGVAWVVNVGAAISISQPLTGAGFFIDAAGNVTIKGKTVNFVQV